MGDFHVQSVTAIAQRRIHLENLFGQARIECEYAIAHLDARVATLDQVNRAGHGAEMNAFPRGAVLNVGQIAAKRRLGESPGPLAVRPGQHPGVGDPTQARAVGSALICLLYTSPSPRDGLLSRMPS